MFGLGFIMWLVVVPVVLLALVIPSAVSRHHCPMVCFCSKGLMSVNCQGKELQQVPLDVPWVVEKLYLGHNRISQIEQKVFKNFKHLKYLELSYNLISNIPSYAFGNLTELNVTFLDHNVIATIYPFAFGNLLTLNSVDLRNNQITDIMKNAFSGCPLLARVTLTTNYLDSVDDDAFEYAQSVKYLSLSANRFKVIPSVKHLTGLQSLIMEGNQVRNATFPISFLDVHNLNDIVLSNNPIGVLTNNTFRHLQNSNVRKLEISRCNIKSVDNVTFSYLNKLQSLRIGQNPLDAEQLEKILSGLRNSEIVSLDIRNLQLDGKIPSNTFAILRNSSLRYLLMSNNKIKAIPDKAFANLPKLLTIDLSACKIEDVSETAFENLAITILFLHDNSLTAVPKGLPPSIQKLYLNGNNIVSLADESFYNLKNVREIHLSKNGIHELHENCFTGVRNLRKLYMDSNKIATLPRKLFNPLIRIVSLDLSRNNLKVIPLTPGLFTTLSSLENLSLADNQCHSLPLDIFQGLSSLMHINLKNNDFGPIFAGDRYSQLLTGLTKVQTIDLSNNNISVLRDATFMDLTSLKELNLEKNRISNWGRDLFASTNSLKTLDLSNNMISTLSMTSLKNLPPLQSINISYNPFACTCDFKEFCRWMKTTKTKLQEKNKILCNSPSTWHNKKVEEFCLANINCIDYTMYYIIGAVGGGFILAFILGCCLYRNRWFVKLRWYRMTKSCRCTGKRRGQYEVIPGKIEEFDAYISCAELDQEWVADKFLPGIDKVCGECPRGSMYQVSEQSN
ncbi:insulin-like growth factor-binding protein complex acid labile subunit isoform X2 [Gigantopelta aegis]|uniref:insulin-like growth factor-binding protein complex acid labile subunit isoform X2 n=1 Tax=Gigantopelta aegis TaxID=1735272 RepID=UPI001B88B228|nr:insulin-like growth factor-binding protein complex acid labile subunit isoform X2 [Gigantopelta aegis]